MSHPPGPYPEPQYGPPPGQPQGTPQGPPPGYGPPPPHTGFGYGPPPPKKGGSGLIVLLVAGAAFVILALGGAVGYLWLWSGGDSGNDNESRSSGTDSSNDSQNSGTGSEDDDSDAESDAEFEGDWSGSMTQYDPDGSYATDWEFQISLLSDSDTGTAEITLDDGSCTLDYTIDQEYADELHISYEVTGGRGSCVETGEITLSKSDSESTLDAEIAVEWPDGTSLSEGSLIRD
ncbi:hypothetical protein F4561_006299 [Lipingzhangella halophila]|uniref:Uncharacterized protein n=1 Tax=Lipingzhangella halophila TaxID=1783352 RepID=A0A7W7RNS2_9ACTN|nr:hypothetical protein [Lipingzhangella halophila]MBB4935405.1 hypothetical protein [Lipingzhangella halophila]